MPQIVGFLLVHVQCETTILITGVITMLGTFSTFLINDGNKNEMTNHVSEETPLITKENGDTLTSKALHRKIIAVLDLNLMMDKDFVLRIIGISCGYVVCSDFDLIFPFFLKV